ncbi:MAG: PTS sugar transporter subunit IIA, partial [Candidatus Latescibacteria bacterium]|nr:PTS sugar transporter subunit IIA [Candidatus Latescibacterota bacterium]
SEREAIMTTGIGGGIAIPHGKTDTVSELVGAFATITGTVEFDSLDNQPVRLAFLLLAPPNATGPHIKMLSRISRVLNRENVGQRLALADTPDDVIAIFREAEDDLFEI